MDISLLRQKQFQRFLSYIGLLPLLKCYLSQVYVLRFHKFDFNFNLLNLVLRTCRLFFSFACFKLYFFDVFICIESVEVFRIFRFFFGFDGGDV